LVIGLHEGERRGGRTLTPHPSGRHQADRRRLFRTTDIRSSSTLAARGAHQCQCPSESLERIPPWSSKRPHTLGGTRCGPSYVHRHRHRARCIAWRLDGCRVRLPSGRAWASPGHPGSGQVLDRDRLRGCRPRPGRDSEAWPLSRLGSWIDARP